MILVKIQKIQVPQYFARKYTNSTPIVHQYNLGVFIGVFATVYACTVCRKHLSVYTVLFDSSIHAVLTDAILIVRTTTAETLQLTPYSFSIFYCG